MKPTRQDILEDFSMEDDMTPSLLRAYTLRFPQLEEEFREIYLLYTFGDLEVQEE